MEATMRRLLLSLTLALTLSAVGASTALAAAPQGAQTAPLYGPNAGFSCIFGGSPTSTTFGFVVLNTPDNRGTVSGAVALRHAAPNATYEVLLIGWPSCSAPKATITTNKQGNGSLHVTAERRSDTKFFVDVARPFPTEEFNSPAVELD
jgi:hypothetical protein